jgi:two-component sensor histidine kinase
VRALIHPEDWDSMQTALDHLFNKREAYQAEFRVRRANGEIRWCAGSAAPTVDETGRVVRISGVTVDITDRKEAEERQVLLAREVDHRAKNALALVQSIVRLTRADSVKEYVNAVEGRIKALSRAHTVLALSRWQGADLGGLVEEELAPFRTGDADKLVLEGPKMLLQPTPAQTLALALHELATNAAKYGALSASSGCVKLVWKVLDGNLVLQWNESGGPEAKKPATSGFGTRIILASVEGQLNGKVAFDWMPDGLQCVMTVPLSDEIGPPESHANGRLIPRVQVASGPEAIPASSIMLVEDEALVAMAVNEAMTDFGFSIVGPFGRLAEATAALKKGGIDAAILDINLGGELVYPLAEKLVEAKVPFIFVTGYGPESIDRRFAMIPVLQKPIEREALERMFVRSDITVGAEDVNGVQQLAAS